MSDQQSKSTTSTNLGASTAGDSRSFAWSRPDVWATNTDESQEILTDLKRLKKSTCDRCSNHVANRDWTKLIEGTKLHGFGLDKYHSSVYCKSCRSEVADP